MCYEEKFQYTTSEKDKCWYNSICDKSRCGEEFCIRHYKMESLVYLAQSKKPLIVPNSER